LRNLIYWSATELDAGTAWDYDFGGHNQSNNTKNQFPRYGIAVHDGDVAAAAIPEPSTLLMFGAGVLGLIDLGRRKKRKSATSR